jgi:hypothetical protein
MQMKIRIALAAAAALSLAIAAVAFAAPSEFKVTGGGQILASADSSGVKGPGDTISFQAFASQDGLDDTADGAINVIDRTPGAGGKGVHYKGTVDCTFIVTDGTGGGYAELYGSATTKSGTETDFVVRIRDNGQGAADETDAIEFDTSGDETCGENEDEEEPGFFLARGNAKIHKASASQSGGAKSTKSSSSLLGALR